MVATILIIHVLYGGFIHLFVTKTIEAVSDYSNLYNWLHGGIVYHHDLAVAQKNAIAWCIASLLYFGGLFALIYVSLNIL